jgi:hypothetical protein
LYPLLSGWTGFLRSGYAFGQALEVGVTEHSGIDHPNQQRLYRSFAEPIHDAFNRAPRYSLPRLSRAINERAIIDAVRQVAFLFEATQYSANRRILQTTIQFFADLVGGH